MICIEPISPEVYRVSVGEQTPSADSVSEIKNLMTEVARALVDDSAVVRIDVFEENDTTVLRLFVAPADVGKVIGKQGRTARSLRTILSAASMKVQHRFALDIVEADAMGATEA
ncbi:KH domain-containing protein [Granulicella cerasi]|uniref:RNA-binding protein KhpA n=1 Tax=Granulicella cerasi TaxID=741063 RepID=A0ABW1Z872_9BACT|nr:KH domain-containing protein [Granulicella cerasi]